MAGSWLLSLLVTLWLAGHAGPAQAVAEAEPAESDFEEEVAVDPAVDRADPLAATGRVARSGFTTEVRDREPVDDVSSLSNDRDRIAYFTELVGLEGRTVVHRWAHAGETLAEVGFAVAGPRWRVHSEKRLGAGRLGTWSVSVVVGDEVLTRETFEYTAAPTP